MTRAQRQDYGRAIMQKAMVPRDPHVERLQAEAKYLGELPAEQRKRGLELLRISTRRHQSV
jgi:hypothetical protein